MKPTWWLLYAIVLEIFVVVIGFALMALWNRRNRVALELDECRRRSGPGRMVMVPPVEIRSTPALMSAWASGTNPVLSETDNSAR